MSGMSSGLLINGAPPAYPLWSGAVAAEQSRLGLPATMTAPTLRSDLIATPSSIPSESSAQLLFADTDIQLELPILDFRFLREDCKIIVKTALTRGAILCIRVVGSVVASGSEFRPEQIGVQVEASGDDASTYFVASTLVALMALTEVGLRVPAIGLSCDRLRFDLPLKEIGQHLSTRETAYKLIVIGEATGNSLDFPPRLTGQEVKTLNFIYRAIVDRTFDWPLTTYPLEVVATAEEFAKWNGLRQPASMTFLEDDLTAELMGRQISIGRSALVLKEAVIKDRERFLSELAVGDGHPVTTVVRALDGRETIECPEAPRLSPNPWPAEQEALIQLKPVLCSLLANRYNSLAASTLEGLTDEEKAAITARPQLSEDAHIIADED